MIRDDEIYGKNPIVSANDYRRHIVNIDTRFRKSALDTPTDCTYAFAHPYKNLIEARLLSVEIPQTAYTFSAAKQNTRFTLQTTQILIPDGNYTPASLVAAIQLQLPTGVTLTYNEANGKATLTSVSPITLTFQTQPTSSQTPPQTTPTPYPTSPTLGLALGFLRSVYTGTTFTSESVVQTQPDPYWLLSVEDWYTVEHKTADSYLPCLAKIIVPPTANTVFGHDLRTNAFTFLRPTDLSQVRLRLVDRQGVPVDLNGVNFSLSLELTEVMNINLYGETLRPSVLPPPNPLRGTLRPSGLPPPGPLRGTLTPPPGPLHRSNQENLTHRAAIPYQSDPSLTGMRIVRNASGSAAAAAASPYAFT